MHGGEALRVAFATKDVHELPAEMLRVMSPSAEVQGHSKEQRVTVAGKRNVKIKELRGVGNYAVAHRVRRRTRYGRCSCELPPPPVATKGQEVGSNFMSLENKGLMGGVCTHNLCGARREPDVLLDAKFRVSALCATK